MPLVVLSIKIECPFSGLEGNEIVGSYNLKNPRVPLSLHTIYNTHTNRKNHTHILTLRVFT